LETQSKSDFIRAQFRQDASASLQSVRAAWAAEGNSGPIWPNIFYRIRREFSGNRPRRRRRRISVRGNVYTSANAPSRLEFVEKNLLENPRATLAELNELWKTDGFSGTLSLATYYSARRRLKLGRRKKAPGRAPERPNLAPADPLAAYLFIEQTLDQLIADAEQIGDRRLIDDLRQARRRVSKALV
jgi:hypothetical protein